MWGLLIGSVVFMLAIIAVALFCGEVVTIIPLTQIEKKLLSGLRVFTPEEIERMDENKKRRRK